MRKTPLYKVHKALGAKLIDFSGWAMPLYYKTQSLEHLAVRESAGIFDVSHMGIVDITGVDAQLFLSDVLANDIQKTVPGKALYSCMLNPAGGIIDDLIAYHIATNHYRLVINASRTQADWDWLSTQAKRYKVNIKQCEDFALLALQGQKARGILSLVLNQPEIATLRPFSCKVFDAYTVAATGYTGEDGFEIMLPANQATELWSACLDKGVMPIGLGARDSLRLEAGLNLYGLDMDETVTPLESNLSWTVAFQPEDRLFIGREALIKQQTQGIKQQLKAIKLLGKGMLRHGQQVVDANGHALGVVTSASHSPLLQCSIGFARVNVEVGSCFVDIRGQRLPAICAKPPLWRKAYKV
ncbi:MAG: Aminomethyltransferase [Pseudomonadota bacterium]|jgi:aminomethyltransferase